MIFLYNFCLIKYFDKKKTDILETVHMTVLLNIKYNDNPSIRKRFLISVEKDEGKTDKLTATFRNVTNATNNK